MPVLWDGGSGMGSLGMLRDLEALHRTMKIGKGLQGHLWGVDPHHAPMWLAPSAPCICGAFLLPSSLLFFQQVIIVFLGMMN